MIWFADTNILSKKTYQEKKEIFGHKYNIRGFDYYVGGVFDSEPLEFLAPQDFTLISEWDWRTRHGADTEGSPYWDDDPDPGETGNGWMTSMKNQYYQHGLCKGLCWAYEALAQMESVANLFLNQHKDYNLSAEHVLDCNLNHESGCSGGHAYSALDFVRDYGVMDRETFPPNGHQEPCNEPSDPNYRITNDGHNIISTGGNFTWEDGCRNLIELGPISTYHKNSHYPDGHFMLWMGYYGLEDGDVFYKDINDPNSDSIVVQTGSPYIGQLTFIYKNSFGLGTGYQGTGYYHHTPAESKPYRLRYLYHGFEDMVTSIPEVSCLDEDLDGYFNWGIGIKPDHCDQCPNTIDGDDSNPRLGSFDNNYYCQEIMPDIEVFRQYENGSKKLINEHDIHIESDLFTDELNFHIQNDGDAQYNLQLFEPIELSGKHENYFNPEILETEDFVRMNGGTWDFRIHYSNTPEPAVVRVQINDNEDDLDPFVFYIAMGSCETSGDPVEIVESTTWDQLDIMTSDVVVKDQSVLTITSTIIINEPSSLIIEQRSRVILDGGCLSKMCDGFWQGVDIIGDETQSQANEEYHGVLQIDNNGTIEFASRGAETVVVNPEYDYYTGGIIKANNAIFKNNETDVFFRPFQNTHPVTHEPFDNLSGFLYCQFITTEELYNMEEFPYNHVNLNEVEGIYFTNCNFENDVEEVTHCDDLGIGIYSMDSRYYVQASCLQSDPQTGECLEWNQSLFENLNYGIYATNSKSNLAPEIEHVDFEKNFTGIYLSAVPSASVTNCYFDIQKVDVALVDNDRFGGVYIDPGCTGFAVEENYYENTDPDPLLGNENTFGIAVNNSGDVYNEIYKNELENLDYGIVAMNDNRYNLTGLQIKCNKFENCGYDIAVTPEGCEGIAAEQGSGAEFPETSANNQFTYFGTSAPTDFDNEGELLTYFYPREAEDYNVEPTYYSNIDPDESDYVEEWYPEDGCPSNLNEPGTGSGYRTIMLYYDQKVDSTTAFLQQLEDAGDTDEMNFDVQNSIPEEAYQIYSELMASSPYLSDSVMVSGTEKENVLTGDMVTDILSANPQAAKSDTVMNAVNNRSNPLTDEQITEINQGLFTVGAKEKIMADIGWFEGKKQYAFHSLLRHFRKDTTNPVPPDSLILLLSDADNIWADYTLAYEYLRVHDSANAINTLNNIPYNYNLTLSQSNNHAMYEDYFELLLQLDSEGKTVLDCDSAEIAELYLIYNDASGQLRAQVRNLLISIDTLTYCEPLLLPNTNKSVLYPQRISNSRKIENHNFTIHPNPANYYITLEVKLPYNSNNDYVVIRNENGILLNKIKINSVVFREILDGKDFKSGFYIAPLYLNGKSKESIKFTVMH